MKLGRTAVGLVGLGALVSISASAQRPIVDTHLSAPDVPSFAVDPFWPQPLPHNWILGQVAGVAVDSRDHVWIVHRPGSLTPNEVGAAQEPPIAECCMAAPAVIEFDPAGEVLHAWGGPGLDDPWPDSEHGIFVDHQDNVWIASSSSSGNVVLKFSRDGERLLQIGEFGRTGGSGDTGIDDDASRGVVNLPAGRVSYCNEGELFARLVRPT